MNQIIAIAGTLVIAAYLSSGAHAQSQVEPLSDPACESARQAREKTISLMSKMPGVAPPSMPDPVELVLQTGSFDKLNSTSIVFSPNGRQVLADKGGGTNKGGGVTLSDAATGGLIRTFATGDGES